MVKQRWYGVAVLAFAGVSLLLLPTNSDAQSRIRSGSPRVGVYASPGPYSNLPYGSYGPYWSRRDQGYFYGNSPYFYSGYYGPSVSYPYGYGMAQGTYPYTGQYYGTPDVTGSALPSRGGYQAFYPPTGGTGPVGTAVLVEVRVPSPDAEVWFGNSPTSQRGPVRQFISPPLSPDRKYVYEVKARWTVNGKAVEQTREVSVSPGQRALVEFSAQTPQGEQLQNPPMERKGP